MFLNIVDLIANVLLAIALFASLYKIVVKNEQPSVMSNFLYFLLLLNFIYENIAESLIKLVQ